MILKSTPKLFLKRCGVLYFLIFVLIGCSQDSPVKETRVLMDTYAEISCYSSDRNNAVNAIDAAFKEMQRIEKVFSKFDEDSEVSKINRLAGIQGTTVDAEILKLIEDSIYYSRISDGAFDITVSPLMEIWGFARKDHVVPDKGKIEETLKRVGYKNIILDSEKLLIKFLDKGVKIDFGAIAKGYAVDRAKDILVSYGIKNSLVNLGGNIFALGNAPGSKNWKIGVQDPRNKERLLWGFELKNRAISTSGNYERFFEIGGKKYSHIMNPVSGEPCQGIISVTVVADSAEEADVLSTTIFVLGEEKGINLAKSIKDIEVLILTEEGKIAAYP